MHDTILIRSRRVDELQVVLDIWRRAGAVPSVSDNSAGLRRLLETDADALLVAEADGQVVGTLIATWDGWRGNLYRMAVMPEYRRRGIALQLVRAGEAKLQDQGAPRSSAMVIGDHEHAVKFWEAAGYGRDERLQRFVRSLK